MRLDNHASVCTARLTAVFAGVLFLAACDGPNQFATPIPGSGTGPGGDTRPPEVDIQLPRGDSLSAKPLGDSVLVRVQVSDNTGVDSVAFFGIAERGDELLGTDTIVSRFEQKNVSLPQRTRDTTLTRYLIATPSDVKETSQIVVIAYDGDGNIAADTSDLVLGGPDVALENVEEGQSIQAGLGLALRVRAQDPTGIIQLQINLSGAFTQAVVKSVNPARDSIVFDTTIVVPDSAAGALSIAAVARNALDVSGQFGPVQVNLVSATAGDSIRPTVRSFATAPERLELQDMVSLEITGKDDTQGSGVGIAGFTVLGISPSRGDTLVRSGTRNLSPPRTGSVSEAFEFPVFNVDSLSLPDTLIFEVTGYLIDGQGNCSASVGGRDEVDLPCDTLPMGEIVAQGRSGQRLTSTIVTGRTVNLPAGGLIMDAVIDSLRRNLYLSNLDKNQIEVFRLQDEAFLTPIPIGSEPWGMTLNRQQDTLMIGNSGGTNVSMVYLGAASGLGPFVEDDPRRLLTPDVILYDVERQIDDLGILRYTVFFHSDRVPPGFSDRPQFLAADSTGRILYSTKTTELGDFGTIRKAFVPDDMGRPLEVRPEVKLFFEHAALETSADFVAVGNVDEITVLGTDSTDLVIITDHVPGFPDDIITGGPALVADAAAQVQAAGSDVVWGTGKFSVQNLGFSDTTFVTASGDGGWVLFGEGAVSPVGRLIMYEASQDRVSRVIEVDDIMTNASEKVQGIGLNYDGTLGVARGFQAYFFTTDLRLQGVVQLPAGGAGAALHPLHANAKSLVNFDGEYRPDTHIAFVGTGEHTVDIIDTFHFFRSGRLFIRDVVQGPLKAVLPFPEDNAGLTCTMVPVTDQVGNTIGQEVEVFENGLFSTPYPPDGATEDSCVVVKLFGVTDSGGVVVIDVRKADILRDHPSRSP